MLTRRCLALLLLAACSSDGGKQAPPDAGDVPSAPPRPNTPVLGRTEALGTVVSPLRRPMLPVYGTDLGWAFAHRDELWVLFGDSWKSLLADGLAENADDALGKLSLREFPDGDAVERWLASQAGPSLLPSWHTPAPPVRLATDLAEQPLPIRTRADGESLSSGPALTPMAGFSNARPDEGAAAFALFMRNEPVPCSAAGLCEGGFTCDPQLGRCSPLDALSQPCVVGTSECDCVPAGGGHGLCQDRTSSTYDPSSERGRTQAVVMRQRVGNALRESDTTFATQPWDTRRFYNAAARTVNDFDPDATDATRHDYAPADGQQPEREGVFIWGRPGFGGVRALGRDAQLYLAWVPMPTYDATGRFAFRPRYFAGRDERGSPRFVERELDAAPLDLDARTDGEQPEEVQDLVGQMAISWVPALGRFVMIYGGGLGTSFMDLIFASDRTRLARDPLGALYVRYAEHPWGPWTPPEPLLVAGAPERGVTGQYGPGGILHHPGCLGLTCAPGEPSYVTTPGETGQLYGPSIIDPWTEVRADGAVDLYWHVSTWNPYQVLLMKTRIMRP